MVAADQALPGTPSIPDEATCKLRIRLIAEELMEYADALGFHLKLDNHPPTSVQTVKSAHWMEVSYITNWPPNLVEAADALSDLNYVVVGSQSAHGIDGEPCDLEVHASNMSKFIDGRKDEHGKWVKGPSTRAPNLRPILIAQGWEG